MTNASRHAGDPPEAVLAHGESLQALARALLGRHDLAEDAVQDTWVRYLEKRPEGRDVSGGGLADPSDRGLGGWLATVLRRLVSNRKRDEARRIERERASARREGFDEPSLREREEALRAVVEAVLALDETGRTVVMLRWFEGLPPREIAARLGVDASVVHARLARAHEKLRTRLERELGPRRLRACLACLAGLGSAPLAPWASITAIGSGGGAMAMASKVLVGSGAALAVVCGALWIGLSGEPRGVGADAGEETVAEPAGAVPAPLVTATAPAPVSERSEVPSAEEWTSERDAAPRPWDAPGFEYELEVLVSDDVDLPEYGRTVYVAPAGHTLNEVGSTASDGRLRIRWLGFDSSMEIDLSIAPDDAVRRMRAVAGAQRVALLGARASTFVFRGGAELVLTGALAQSGSRLAVAPSIRTADPVSCERDAEGRVVFVEPSLAVAVGDDELPSPAIRLASFADMPRTLVLPRLEIADLDRLMVEHLANNVRLQIAGGLVVNEPAQTVRGRVLDAEGRALAGVHVGVWRAESVERSGTRTDELGDYAIGAVSPGEWRLRAGGGDHGRADALVTLVPGQTFEWSPVIDRGLELRGRLLDRERAPLGGWRIEVEDGDPYEPRADATTTAADGTFAIPNLPPRALRVLARPGDAPDGSALLLSAAFAPGGSEIELLADVLAGTPSINPTSPSSSLALEVAEAAGGEVRLVRARAWRVDTARAVEGEIETRLSQSMSDDGTVSEPSHGPSAVRFLGLSHGWYRVELQFTGRAPLVLAPAYVPPGEAADLGTVVAPRPVRLELGGLDGLVRGVALVQRGESVELRCALDVTASKVLHLAEGEYELSVRDGGNRRREHVRASPGETVRIGP